METAVGEKREVETLRNLRADFNQASVLFRATRQVLYDIKMVAGVLLSSSFPNYDSDDP